MARAIMIILVVAITLYALLDCIRTSSDAMPGRLPKFVWILLILLFPTIGGIAWILISRVARAENNGGRLEPTLWSSPDAASVRLPQIRLGSGGGPGFGPFGSRGRNAEPQAPDDDPEFLAQVEAQVRRRQREEYEKKKRQEQDNLKEDIKAQPDSGCVQPGDVDASEDQPLEQTNPADTADSSGSTCLASPAGPTDSSDDTPQPGDGAGVPSDSVPFSEAAATDSPYLDEKRKDSSDRNDKDNPEQQTPGA